MDASVKNNSTTTEKHSLLPVRSDFRPCSSFWYSESMHTSVIDQVFSLLENDIQAWQEPIVGRVSHTGDPFKVLTATMLSLRTKDATTAEAVERLFALAPTPQALARTSPARIEAAIYPVGFYKTKARHLRDAARLITGEHHGHVPDTMEGLLTLPGVGRKTANLVLILGFDKMGICVDTHVHRITNRWGYVTTKTPDETEIALREVLPLKHWKTINNLLVPYGQNRCLPTSPFCSACRIAGFCERRGVRHAR